MIKEFMITVFCDLLDWHDWIDDEDAPFAGLLRCPAVCSRCGEKTVIEISPYDYKPSGLYRKNKDK